MRNWPLRIAFALAGASAVLVIATVVLTIALRDSVPVTWDDFRPFNVVIGVGFSAAGLMIIRRQSGNLVGWMLLLGALGNAAFGAGIGYSLYAQMHGWPAAAIVVALAQGAWIPLPVAFAVTLAVFPDGRTVGRRWRPLPWALIGAGGLWLAGVATTPFSPASLPSPALGAIRNPIELPFGPLLSAAGPMIVLAGEVLGVVSLVLRFRRSAGIERQQMKWLVLAAPPLAITFLSFLGPFNSVPLLSAVAVLLFATPIVIAITRYRLYDIDLIISRALVYGALATFITAVYVGVVVGLGRVIGSGSRYNLGLSIVATAVVAVAFQPLRARLQRLANRLVYGVRATPYEVLSQFSAQVAQTYAGGDVLARMARLLGEGTGAASAEVWLRSGGLLRRAAAWPGADVEPAAVAVSGQLPPDLSGDRAVPVRHEGELLGALTITKARGDAVTPLEERLLDDLAHQAGLVLKNVGLTADLRARVEELRASRQRLVRAQDEERRRLERNLHDGAQQNLVALKVKLSLAEIMVERDPARAGTLLQELKSETDEALETLRDLARGIYPPLLAEQGLRAAIEAQARKATLPVAVDADGIGRYSQDVEAAVYFCVLEALQNVQKYAHASAATVRMAKTDGELEFEVSDDGEGFDPARAHGSGLQNMRDRLDALSGSLRIVSRAGATSVSGTVTI